MNAMNYLKKENRYVQYVINYKNFKITAPSTSNMHVCICINITPACMHGCMHI